MKHIPNIFTLLNLFFGCLAIVTVLQTGVSIAYAGEIEACGMPHLQAFIFPEKIWLASLFILLSAVVDFLDGFVARFFKAESAIGKQLDSLADVVSFGVAPSMIFYFFLMKGWSASAQGLDTPAFYYYPAFILACASAYRLAKFNVDESQSTSFKGVPTPAVGLLVASFPMIAHYNNSITDTALSNVWVLYLMILLLSWLMVSNLPMMSLKVKSLKWGENKPLYILFIIGLLAVLLLKFIAVPVIFISYIILSLIYKNKFSNPVSV